MNWLYKPARPKSKIRPKPTTNGGMMMGNMANTFRGRAKRVCPRSAHNAIKVPMRVVPAAVSRAK